MQLSSSHSPECRATSLNRDISATLVRTYVQNALVKIGGASPVGYIHEKAAKRSSKDLVEWLHIQTCLVPSWCEGNRTIWDCWKRWGISSSPRVAASATLLEEDGNENEWVHEILDLLLANVVFIKLFITLNTSLKFVLQQEYRDICLAKGDKDIHSLEICQRNPVFNHWPIQKLIENPGSWIMQNYKPGEDLIS